jgi:Zn-dependent peptidase ImmA (M78 family)
MHELSHILLVHEPSQLMVSPNTPYVLRSYNKEMEDEATWLAGCLLLPRAALVDIRLKDLGDSEVCDSYGVSIQLLTMRLNVTGVSRQFPISR